jgi:hypothetical protein
MTFHIKLVSKTWITDAKRRVTENSDIAKDAIFFVGEPRDKIGHKSSKPTPSVVTPPKDAIFTKGDSRNAMRQAVRKLTPSVATPPYVRHAAVRHHAWRR